MRASLLNGTAAAGIILLFGVIPTGSGRAVPSLQEPEVVILTEHGAACWPSWSPDGDRIAYLRWTDFEVTRFGEDRQVPICELWIMDRNGTDLRRFTEKVQGDAGMSLFPPSWSSEGRMVSVDRVGTPGIFAGNAEWGDPVGPGIIPQYASALRFSPVGTRFVCSELKVETDPLREIRRLELHNYRIQSSTEILVTTFNAETEWEEPPPVWSTDGTMVRIRESAAGRGTFHFYSVEERRIVLSSGDPRGGEAYAHLFPDRSLSPSGRYQVSVPAIPWRHQGSVSHRAAGDLLEVVPVREGEWGEPVFRLEACIHSYQWHPSEDILLFATGAPSRSPEERPTSDLKLVLFPGRGGCSR
jgi:hypothetical protein